MSLVTSDTNPHNGLHRDVDTPTREELTSPDNGAQRTCETALPTQHVAMPPRPIAHSSNMHAAGTIPSRADNGKSTEAIGTSPESQVKDRPGVMKPHSTPREEETATPTSAAVEVNELKADITEVRMPPSRSRKGADNSYAVDDDVTTYFRHLLAALSYEGRCRVVSGDPNDDSRPCRTVAAPGGVYTPISSVAVDPTVASKDTKSGTRARKLETYDARTTGNAPSRPTVAKERECTHRRTSRINLRLPADLLSFDRTDTSGDEAPALEPYRAELNDAASRKHKVAKTLRNDEVLARSLALESEDSDPGTASEWQRVSKPNRCYVQVVRATKSARNSQADSSASLTPSYCSAAPHSRGKIPVEASDLKEKKADLARLLEAEADVASRISKTKVALAVLEAHESEKDHSATVEEAAVRKRGSNGSKLRPNL